MNVHPAHPAPPRPAGPQGTRCAAGWLIAVALCSPWASPAVAQSHPFSVRPPAADASRLPTPGMTLEQRVEMLQRRVQLLQERLDAAERRLASHRHVYSTRSVNQMNAQSLAALLRNAETRDTLLGFPGPLIDKETGPPTGP
jgi:hypothetical protein